MTVIAWDGKMLAADRLTTIGEIATQTRKAWKISGNLVGFSGTLSSGLEMMNWLENGAKPEEFPECQKGEDWARVLLITPGKQIFEYCESPIPMEFLMPFHAIGTGQGVALGVMEMGGTALQAVEAASKHVIACGGEIDVLTLDDDDD